MLKEQKRKRKNQEEILELKSIINKMKEKNPVERFNGKFKTAKKQNKTKKGPENLKINNGYYRV